MLGQFTASTHGGDLDLTGAPSGEIGYFAHRSFFQVKESDDNLFPRIESRDQLVQKAGKQLPLGIGSSHRSCLAAFLDNLYLGFTEVRVSYQGTSPVFAQPVVAGSYGDPGYPVAEWLRPSILIDLEKDLEEDFLGHVIVICLFPQVVADVCADGGIEDFNECPISRLIPCLDSAKEFAGDRGGGSSM